MSEYEEFLLRMLSKLDYYRLCQRCRVSRKHRDFPVIEYDEKGRGAFPLCEKCFYELHPVIAARYFKKLWAKEWERSVDDEARIAFQTFIKKAHDLQMEKNGKLGDMNSHEAREWMHL